MQVYRMIESKEKFENGFSNIDFKFPQWMAIPKDEYIQIEASLAETPQYYSIMYRNTVRKSNWQHLCDESRDRKILYILKTANYCKKCSALISIVIMDYLTEKFHNMSNLGKDEKLFYIDLIKICRCMHSVISYIHTNFLEHRDTKRLTVMLSLYNYCLNIICAIFDGHCSLGCLLDTSLNKKSYCI